jgi:hypothetical protein
MGALAAEPVGLEVITVETEARMEPAKSGDDYINFPHFTALHAGYNSFL